jgi:hypothetical protein
MKEALQTAVRQCFWAAGTTREYSNFQKQWEKCVQRDRDFAEK